MTSVTETHDEKETLSVEVLLPGQDPRGSASSLFVRTRKALIEREGGRCFVCGGQEATVGPLEAHHCPIEHSVAIMVDWDLVKRDCLAGEFGFSQAQRDAAKAFDWAAFDPADPFSFVDNMMVNGLLLDKAHHIGKDEGIHSMPHPLWLAQRYAKEGYKFSEVEIIHHQSYEEPK